MVFDREWFETHQRGLLLFANTPVGRYVLRIHGKRSSVGRRKIIKIAPNAITWREGRSLKTEFRTHAKFSKRLYYAFRPLWYLLHGWDMTLGRAYNFGFDTLTVFPDADPETSTVDGTVSRGVEGADEDFATIRAGAGTDSDDSEPINDVAGLYTDAETDKFISLTRGIFLFDTSSIPDGNELAGATLSLFPDDEFQDNGLGETDLHVCGSSPASNTSLAASDYGVLGNTSFGSVAYANWLEGEYADISLNATGIASISKVGISKFGTRLGWDLNGSFTGIWASGTSTVLLARFADRTGTSTDPMLVVTHAAPASDVSLRTLMGVGV